MLRKKTTFVLGAGASSELGFPLGRDLQLDIQASARRESSRLSSLAHYPTENDLGTVPQYLSALGHKREAILWALSRIGEGLSLSASIDTFLYNNRHDQAVIDCGKLYVLDSILRAERKSPLYSEEQAQVFCERLHKAQRDGRRYSNTHQISWIDVAIGESYLAPIWAELSASHGIRDIERVFDNVAFVNFNYDRSLEECLGLFLCRTFGVLHNEAAAIVDKVNMVRPYGSPHGRQAYSSTATRFGSSDSIMPAEAITNFRTFTESVEKDVANRAQRLVADSNILVFLGFAFHPQNLDLLQVSDCAPKSVFFSHYGDSDENRSALRVELAERLGPQRGPGTKLSVSDIHGWIGTSTETLNRLGQGIFRSR